MLALHRTLGWRYLRQRWSRAALVIASIALGVATLVATRILNQCMTQAAHGNATPLGGSADLILSNTDHGVRRDLVDELRKAHLPGIIDVQPLVFGRVSLPQMENDAEKRQALLIGVDLSEETASSNAWGVHTTLNDSMGAKLAVLAGCKPVFVGRELAAALPGGIDRVQVRRAAGQVSTLAGLGTVDAHGPAANLGGNVLVMRLNDAAALVFSEPGLVSRIDLRLTPEADRAEIQRRVRELVGDRAEVRSPEANDKAVRDVMAGLELGFLLGGLGALVVGLFLVYNALSVTVAERRHDIGILRSLGATRGQVARLFAGEAALLGLTGALLGVPLGYGMALAASGPLQRVISDVLLPMGNQRLPLTASTIVISMLAGIVTALVAAVVPALRAASQEPADAVRRAPLLHGWRWRGLQIAISGLVIGAGFAFMAMAELLPQRVGSFGGIVLVLIGTLLATPLLAEGAARLLGPATRRCLGIEGRLAADNLARSPGRTGLVIAALAAGVALIFETAGLTLSSERAILAWINDSLSADLFVTCSSPVASGGQSQPIDEKIGTWIEELPEVKAIMPVRFRRLDFNDTIVFMIALDAVKYRSLTEGHTGVRGQELFPRLAEPGTCLVSENFALLHKVKVGDTITLRGPHGPVGLRVLGTVLDYSWNRGTVIMERAHYKEQFKDPMIDALDIYLQPGVNLETARETIARRFGAEHSLVVMTQDELRAIVIGMVRRLYGLAYAQELVVGLVAALGVVTALLISVLQRRRELGLLRAVGASRGQVLRSVLAEAVLMGIIGSAIGLLIGLPLEWYAVRVILLEETGFSFPVIVPWTAAALVVGLAVGTATLAGLGPALHAMRLRIPEAIAYE